MHSKRAQSNHLPSDCPTPPRRAQGTSLQANPAMEMGIWKRVNIIARTQAILPLSASVLPSCLFKNIFPSVYTYDIENRGQRYRNFVMGRNKDMYFSLVLLLNSHSGDCFTRLWFPTYTFFSHILRSFSCQSRNLLTATFHLAFPSYLF